MKNLSRTYVWKDLWYFIFADKQFLIVGGIVSGNGNNLATELIDVNSSSTSSLFGDIPSKRDYAVGGLLGSTPITCGGRDPYED